MHIGNHEHPHSGAMRGQHAGVGIFESHTLGRLHLELVCRFKIDIWRGLSMRYPVARHDHAKTRPEFGSAKAYVRVFTVARSRDGERDPACLGEREKFEQSGFERNPFFGYAPPQFFPSRMEFWRGEARAEAAGHFAFTILGPAADEARVQNIVEDVADFGSRTLPGSSINRLGIEHEPIHIHDDGGNFHGAWNGEFARL